jgi:hypothetical protein
LKWRRTLRADAGAAEQLLAAAALAHMRNTPKTGGVKDGQRAIADLDQSAAAKFGQYFTDMHGGQTGGIGDVMLTQREFHLHGRRFGRPGHAPLRKSFRDIENEAHDTPFAVPNRR